MSAALTRPEFLLLLFVLVFSPFAFGTVEPWSHAVAAFAALAALAIALRRRTREGQVRLLTAPGTLPLLLFLAIPLLQATPLPPAMVLLISPRAHAFWSAALGDASELPWLTLSLAPGATVREFFRFSALAAVYLLTVQVLARRERLRAAAAALAIVAAVLSFEAIVQSLVAPLRLLFVRPSPSPFAFGPFVNRNHFANLMAMLTPVLLGLFFARGTGGRGGTARQRLVDLLARPESGVRILLGFSALLTASSLVISLSRGATVAAVAALAVFGGCLAMRRSGTRRGVSAALFVCCLAVFVGWFGWGKVSERFSNLGANPEIVDSVRAGLWRDTLRISADFPHLGSGLGTFASLYPAYRTIAGPFAIDHAHSDHLELLAGGGAVGLGLFLWFVASVLVVAARACGAHRDQATPYLAFGSLAGCVAFLVHGASDFSLSIGANSLFFFFLLGLVVVSSHAPDSRPAGEFRLGRSHLPGAVANLVVALAATATVAAGADLAARFAWKRAKEFEHQSGAPPSGPGAVARLVGRAALLQPLDPRYPAALARDAAGSGDTSEALRLTRRSLRLLPVDTVTLAQLGTLLAHRGAVEPARRAFAAAVAADPAAAPTRERLGSWLLSQGDRAGGLAQLREALDLAPERAAGVFSLMVLAGCDDGQIAGALPSNREVLLRFARYAAATGNLRLAGETYTRVLGIDPGNREAISGLGGLTAR